MGKDNKKSRLGHNQNWGVIYISIMIWLPCS